MQDVAESSAPILQILSEAHALGAHGAQVDRTLTLGGAIFIGVVRHGAGYGNSQSGLLGWDDVAEGRCNNPGVWREALAHGGGRKPVDGRWGL